MRAATAAHKAEITAQKVSDTVKKADKAAAAKAFKAQEARKAAAAKKLRETLAAKKAFEAQKAQESTETQKFCETLKRVLGRAPPTQSYPAQRASENAQKSYEDALVSRSITTQAPKADGGKWQNYAYYPLAFLAGATAWGLTRK